MAITRLKFESYFDITGKNKSLYETKDKKLEDKTIIEVALKEYDVNLTEKDLKEMREDYESLIYKYIN